MKKLKNVICWAGFALFCMMSVYALTEGGYIGAVLLLLGGVIIAPLSVVSKLRRKLKLNRVVSVLLAVVLMFAGVLLTPTSNLPSDTDNSSSVSDTASVADDSTPSTDQNTDSTPEQVTPSNTDSTDGGQTAAIDLSSIPAYSGQPFAVINNNVPNFSADELKTVGYETYSNLDALGRTQFAIASVGKDTMPADGEERGSISSITPTGWKQATYDNISGKYLYNRCHLIGWQLSAENANEKNLITGTKYLNIEGMLPFENMVADYIKETGNHVAYRITPIYQGDNLLASGVQIEAYSVEDSGEGICFNVYCYNVQPDIIIDYTDGSSRPPDEADSDDTTSADNTTSTNSTTSTENTPSSTDTISSADSPSDSSSQTVYITDTGKKYHSAKNCSGLSNAKAVYESTLSDAQAQGLTPCAKCH